MNTPGAVENSSNSKGFVTRVFEMDTDTKNGLINGIQYIVMAVVPIAIVDMLTKHLFTTKNPSDKGTFELLAEVLGQAVLTLILLFMVHKLIIAVPTYTGTPMTRINYSTVSLGFLMTAFALNHVMSEKINVIFARIQDHWEGKSEDDKHKKHHKHDKSKVSVSQPISGRAPTHQVSRADYTNSHAAMMPVQTGQPPIVPTRSQPSMQPQRQPQQEPASGQQMYGGPSNPLVDAATPGGLMEPMAANSVLGGGGSWSAW